MKLVIQCACRKYENAGRLRNLLGEQVVFVAHPEKCAQSPYPLCCKPDDEITPGRGTWREFLIQYNQQGSNPEGLFKAADLYKPSIYHDLVVQYGWQNVFILSAGWGLIRSDYLIPYYDITFSNQGKLWSKRGPSDGFHDFNQLTESSVLSDETVYFFGGNDYLPLYYSMTQNLAARKVIYGRTGHREGYEYVPYRSYTNWHYSCAKDFIEDRVPK